MGKGGEWKPSEKGGLGEWKMKQDVVEEERKGVSGGKKKAGK